MRKTIFIYEGEKYDIDNIHELHKKMDISFDLDNNNNDGNNMNKYITTSKNLRNTLEKYGVAIIPKVIDPKECEEMYSGMWDYFEHITQNWDIPLDRNNQDTWREFYKLIPLHSMLIQTWNAGHAQVSWNLRQNTKIIDVFAELWSVKRDELLVSFDGMSLHLPPEITNRGWFRDTWYHTDQSPLRDDFECVQSWITAKDINEGDGTIAILEGSHKYHAEFAERFDVKGQMEAAKKAKKPMKPDWYKFTKEEQNFYMKEKGCKEVRIVCGKGDLILWDSRTSHCGVEPSKNRQTPSIRAVIYLCYIPRTRADKNELEKKKKAFNELRGTSHYPHIITNKMFSKKPRVYSGEPPEITEINTPLLTDLGKKLAGF